MLRKLALAVSAALVAAVLSPFAAAQGGAGGGRAFRSQTIRAGVIMNPSATQIEHTASATPFVWYNLDNATSVKPPEWTFVNPNNEGTVSSTTYTRWSQIDPSIAAGDYPARVANGLRTQKRYASYWEVNLVAASDSDLAQYDVLLFAPQGFVQLNPSERSKLARFVDGGGVLWVDFDPSLATLDAVNGLPVPFSATPLATPFSAPQHDYFHPLYNHPLRIEANDLNRLSFQYGPTSPAIAIGGPELSGPNGLLMTILWGEHARLRPVSQIIKGAAYYPLTAIGPYGDGYQVVTVRQIAQKLNRTAADPTLGDNRRFVAREPKLLPEGLSAAKFAVNLVSLTSSAPQFGGGSRKGFASGTDIGAPLLNRFSARHNAPGGVGDTLIADPQDLRPPVVYKGFIFVTLNNTISVYDADPSRDADGDGDPDDGLIDYSVGLSRDLVFQTPAFGARISSATVTEVNFPNAGIPRDQLLVTDETGRLGVFPVYGNVSGGRRQWPTAAGATVGADVTLPASPTGGISAGEGPTVFAPTVYGSFAYLTDTQTVAGNPSGRIRVIDLQSLTAVQSGGQEFVAGGSGNPTPLPSGPVTVGQIPIADNSGGSDIVAYMPVRGTTAGSGTGPGVVSFWIGARGEKPFLAEITPNGTGGTLRIETRASTQGGLPVLLPGTNTPLGLRVTILKRNGQPYNLGEMNGFFDGAPQEDNGVITIPVNTPGWPGDVDPDNPVRIDYTIDWGEAVTDGTAANIERGRILFANPAGGADGRRIIGGLALGPQGTLFATASTQDIAVTASNPRAHGTVYALKEEGRGAFRMVWRWDLYPRHTFAYEGGTTTYESALPDNDPVQFLQFGAFNLNTFLGGRFSNATIQGAPVVRGDKVFVTVSGAKVPSPAIQSPASAVLAFAAEPPQPEIRTNLDLSGGFAIVQPDFARSADPQYPRTQSILSSNNGQGESVIFDKAANGVGGTIRFTSLASVRNGQIVDSISLSQPIIIRRPGQGDVVVEPSLQGRWSPLQWYSILHGTRLVGPAFAAGNTLYMSGSSVLPQFLIDGGAGIPRFDGLVTAIRTDVDTTNALPTTQAFTTSIAQFSPQSVVLDAGRPWMRQLISMDYPRASASFASPQAAADQLYSTPYFVMPQNPRNTEERGRFSFDDYRVRLLQAVLPESQFAFPGVEPSSYGVVGADRTLVAWNRRHVYGFTRSDFWIADEGRIARVDPSGNVLFDSRASLRHGDAGESGAANVVPLVRPTRVVPVSGDDDLLVVDTGANKILRMDPNGSVSRELGGFVLDPNFVPNGFRNNAPLTFRNPRDATTFTTRVPAANNSFSSPAPLEEWVHTLVADEGNNRLVEIVDRIELDQNTFERVRYVGQRSTLLWHSPAQVSGKGYDYVSISRVRIPSALNAPARYAYVAGLGSFAPGRQDAGEVPPADTDATATVPGATPPADGRDARGGGIVVFDPQLPAGVAVYSSIEVPAIQNIHRWNDRLDVDATDAFTDTQGLNDDDDGWSVDTGELPAQTFGTNNAKRLNGVSSVTASVVDRDADPTNGVDPVIAVMIADRTGVYEVMPVAAGTPTDPNRTILQTRWMITEEAYRALRRTNEGGTERISPDSPQQLRATYARRLDNENVLLVNGFVGKTRGRWDSDGNLITAPQAFNGEIIQIDGRITSLVSPRGNISEGFNVQNDNLGFGSRSVKVRFGVLEGARGILQPVFADRR